MRFDSPLTRPYEQPRTVPWTARVLERGTCSAINLEVFLDTPTAVNLNLCLILSACFHIWRQDESYLV